MDAQLSFFQLDPASLILCFLCISLLDYFFNNWTEQVEDQSYIPIQYSSSIKIHRKCADGETPLTRESCGFRHLRHREKVLAGVKRRLDQQF